ncbi:hypothetical protein Pcinc_031195 [Petrolisthes cinctipes]|uniref:chitinase n=1 Tax=Petrolisthes cinctipes TaxID=88211 RepID=A0AAE1EX49_PETCI|nr:hypothetical protein Pcinc_031195 [Petrolisthes cinctipes]
MCVNFLSPHYVLALLLSPLLLLLLCVLPGDGVSIRERRIEVDEAEGNSVSNISTSNNSISSLPLATSSDDERVMLCYHGSWAVYRPSRGKFVVEDIDPFLCTHLVYAFAGLHADTHTIYSLDPYNDLYENYGKGGYKRFTGLKKVNSDLKTLLGLGGWTEGSTKYSQMVSSKETRATFINSSVAFLHKYGFDGMDIDWEYPTLRGGKPQDKVNFGLLLKEMRPVFDQHGLLITAAVCAGKLTIDVAYDIQAFASYLDLVNLMAYDFHGSWERFAHHHEPLYAYSKDKGAYLRLNVDYAVRYWIHLGLPPTKLLMGVGTYGRCYTLTSPANTTPYSSAPQPGLPGPYTRARGILGYNEICEAHRKGGWTVVRDKTMVSPYTYSGRQWCGYDDPTSAAVKAHYIKNHGLAGAMVWSLDTDDFSGYCSTSPQQDPEVREEEESLGVREESGETEEEVREEGERGETGEVREEGEGRDIGEEVREEGERGETEEVREERGETEEEVREEGEGRDIGEERMVVTIREGENYLSVREEGIEEAEENESVKEEEGETEEERNAIRIRGEEGLSAQKEGGEIEEEEGETGEERKAVTEGDGRIEREGVWREEIRGIEQVARRIERVDSRIGRVERRMQHHPHPTTEEINQRTEERDGQEWRGNVRFPIITTIRTILRDGRPIPTPTPAPIPTPTTTDIPTTTTTTSPTPTPTPTHTCHREGFNADPNGDCTVFYECHQEDGKWRVWEFHCAPGTVFVEDLQGCDFPDLHPPCPLMPTLPPRASGNVPSYLTLLSLSRGNLHRTLLPTLSPPLPTLSRGNVPSSTPLPTLSSRDMYGSPLLPALSNGNVATTTLSPNTGDNFPDNAFSPHTNVLNYDDDTNPSNSQSSNDSSNSLTSQNNSSSPYSSTNTFSSTSSSSFHYINSVWDPERKAKWMKTYRALMEEGMLEKDEGESNTV